MEGRLHSRPRASSSGTGSNLNNMICNFSRNSGVTTQNTAAYTAGNKNSRPIYMNRTHSDHVPPAVENMSKSMGTSYIMSLRDRVSE
jgi:hypothetical protein